MRADSETRPLPWLQAKELELGALLALADANKAAGGEPAELRQRITELERSQEALKAEYEVRSHVFIPWDTPACGGLALRSLFAGNASTHALLGSGRAGQDAAPDGHVWSRKGSS